MLVLTRKSEESIIVGTDIEIKVLGIKGDQVTLGFRAPSDVSIFRKEIYDSMAKENGRAVRRNPKAIQQAKDLLKKPFPHGPSDPSSKPV